MQVAHKMLVVRRCLRRRCLIRLSVRAEQRRNFGRHLVSARCGQLGRRDHRGQIAASHRRTDLRRVRRLRLENVQSYKNR